MTASDDRQPASSASCPVLLRTLMAAALAVTLAVLPEALGGAGTGDTSVLLMAVRDRVTGEPIAGASVSLVPAVPGTRHSTNSLGYFLAHVPNGSYQVKLARSGYRSRVGSVTAGPGKRSVTTLSLDPTSAVIVDAGPDRRGLVPGSSVSLQAKVVVRDSSLRTGQSWRLESRPDAGGRLEAEPDSPAALLELPEASTFKETLLSRLRSDGRLLDRWTVLGLTPIDLDRAGTLTVRLTVTTDSGRYSDDVSVVADLSSFAASNSGLRTVPVGQPVLLHGAAQPVYLWQLRRPAGSVSTLADHTSRNPHFTPDVGGVYELLEGGEPRLRVYAGRWSGSVLPPRFNWPEWVGEGGCYCHYDYGQAQRDGVAEEPIFESWLASGHAEIFRQVIDLSPRNQTVCFRCHTLGYDPQRTNGGFDDAPGFTSFLNDESFWQRSRRAARLRAAPGNWERLLVRYPEVAQLANVQCDSCHGPTDSLAHMTRFTSGASARISLASTVCAPCHEEPADDVFHEWLESGHSSYDLAVEASTTDGHGRLCKRCHSAQGFLGREDTPPDGLEPVTCTVCHDPHNPGSSFRHAAEKVPVRWQGRAGGRAALCISCHRLPASLGLYDDVARPQLDSTSAPHAPQADVLRGRNAFFTEPGQLSNHLRIEDSCIWCHMKRIPLPAAIGYPRGGARHTFSTTRKDCATAGCHGGTHWQRFMDDVQQSLPALKASIGEQLLAEIERHGWIGLDSGEGGHRVAFGEIRELRAAAVDGEMALLVDTEDGPLSSSLGSIRLGGSRLLGSPTGQVIAKAIWNQLLIEADASDGAHNPEYVLAIVGNSIEALNELQAPRLAASE